MTLVVTVVMVFVYSAIAFSWFGKYYLQDMAGGHVKDHCESVLSVSLQMDPLKCHLISSVY